MKRSIKWVIGISSVLLIISIFYSVFRERDPYKYYTGLGSELTVSENDEKLAFSYYLDGNEGIYTANADGTEVTKISKEKDGRLRGPKFSADGEKIMYLSENKEEIQTLMMMNADGSEPKSITTDRLHVTDAIFSPTSETVYYIAMPAEAANKAEGETKEGYDLYSLNLNETEAVQLTDKDHFSMNDLSISEDGAELYYSLFNEREQLYSYSVKEKKETKADAVDGIKGDIYASSFSKGAKYLAYVTVSEESKNESLFEYELYSKKLETSKTKKLTELKSNVQSPVFFHKTDKIAFLHYENWSSLPEEYQLMTVAVDGGKPEAIDLKLPTAEKSHWFMKTIEYLLSDAVISVYYIVLIGAITVYLRLHSKKVYIPSLISLGLAVFIFITSFVVGSTINPWYGIGLAMVAIALFLCSLLLLLFAFVVKKVIKPL